MNTQSNFLQNIIHALDQAEIPYMLSGSIAGSFHGHPRATNDADLIIDPTEKQLRSFMLSLGPDYPNANSRTPSVSPPSRPKTSTSNTSANGPNN